MQDALVRRARLAEAMREVLSEVLLTEVKDPRLSGVVISAVELSGDLKLARAYFSVFGDEERERQAADGLTQARGFLRRESARRMRMHNPPDIEFRRDKGFERADRIARVLDKIQGDRGPGSGVRDDQDPDSQPAAGAEHNEGDGDG
ncbi:MAG: 30S ribosome-binding factor RbfA [Acidobacteriia bacterium]|nr:30S ribosome-binding factor RbfA [Terriglobia bacterium]